MSYTIGEMLIKSTREFSDKTAVICDGRQVSYRELNARVNQRAHDLSQSGITRSSRVALLMYNCIELIEIYFALAKLGVVGIPLNFRLTGPELLSIFEHSLL